jgi:hypothetical protein
MELKIPKKQTPNNITTSFFINFGPKPNVLSFMSKFSYFDIYRLFEFRLIDDAILRDLFILNFSMFHDRFHHHIRHHIITKCHPIQMIFTIGKNIEDVAESVIVSRIYRIKNSIFSRSKPYKQSSTECAFLLSMKILSTNPK